MIGNIYENSTPVSAYMPSEAVRAFTSQVKKEYNEGVEIITRPWTELNDRSVIDDQNNGQRMFNAYVDTSVDDSNEAWKFRGTGSNARNKAITMHAQVAANFLLPLFLAQNEDDEIDQDMSEVMRDIIEWMAQPTVSNYQSSFLQMVFSMETNPVTYLGAEYNEIYQTIKTAKGNGKFETKEILDEVESGFKCPIWGASQVLITNAFERNIQRQRCIIKRRYVDYADMEAKYGEHENWGYVQSGIRSVYNDEDGLFYDIKDEDHPNLVAEEIYEHRRGDLEVPFVSGIFLGNEDDSGVDNNPIKHRDNRGAPKYNVTPFGFHRIGEHFFFYKSMMNALQWDNMRLDALDEIEMNRAILEVETPIAIYGTDKKIDSSVVFPNSVTVFESPDAKVQPLLPPSNLLAGLRERERAKQSLDDGSVSSTVSGQLPEASQKAYTVAQARADAKKMIGAVGKSLAESVVQYGDLMKDIALNNYTTAQVTELLGGKTKLKYRKFFLTKEEGGQKVEKTIHLDESLIGKEMSAEMKKVAELKMLEESGWPKNYKPMVKTNPQLLAKFNYFCKVDIEEMFAKGQEYWQQILTALYAQLAQNPLIDQEALLKKLMYAYFQSEGESLVKKAPEQMLLGQAPQTNFPQQIQNKMTASAVQPTI